MSQLHRKLKTLTLIPQDLNISIKHLHLLAFKAKALGKKALLIS